jgi:integrase/recombinase XerC
MSEREYLPNGVCEVAHTDERICTTTLAVVAAAPRVSDAIEAVVETFLSGRNERTIRAYRHDLADFARFLDAASISAASRLLFSASAFDANVLAHSYRANLLQRRLQPASINRRLAALRSLVKWGAALGAVNWELIVKNERAVAYRDTRGPSATTVRRLLLVVSRRTDAHGVRDFALLRLLYDLALRRNEVATLEMQHVSLDRMTILILRKGYADRVTMTIGPLTAAALQRWIEARGSEDGPLFTNFDRARKSERQRLTGTSINRIVQSWGRKLGLHLTAHQIRHSAITAALDVTQGDVRAVARFSGHKKIETLLIYDDNRRDMGGEISRIISAAADPLMGA